MQPPIACTLGTADAVRERTDEWRSFFALRVTGFEITSETHVRFRLGSSDADLVAAVDLARREKQCCGFFDFTVEVEAECSWLVAGVPDEAIPVLADFVQLARSAS